ncbi:MAG: hypothetical protein E7L40_13620 [Corynebacterium kroppenstedtii]|nr:hypothetical protein [Corynebacterium kroppenstedtii]
MSFFLKSLAAGVFTIASFSVGATTAPVLDTTPQMAYEDISRSLTELQPITFQSGVEKYKILVFVDNQCVYCSYVVKNIKKYTDAGLTMSFLTVVPSSIKDSVIEDMGRVWCASGWSRLCILSWVVFLQIKFSLNSSKRTKRMVTWR